MGGFVDEAPFELDSAVFCFPLLPGIAGGTVAGEPLMVAFAIEPPASFGLLEVATERAETRGRNNRAGAVRD